MRRSPDGSIQFSPKDLIAYLEGDFAAWCERNRVELSSGAGRAALAGAPLAADVPDEEQELVVRRGLAHEAAHLERLRSLEPDLVEIARDASASEATRQAMTAGAPIIFQGELRAEPWMGIADFLHRVPGNSTLGDFHYEAWDTKLARTAKPYFLVQLCAYAEMLEAMQGLRPERLGFVLGDGSEASFRTADFWHYYRRLKRSFETFQSAWLPNTVPDPALDRAFGQWAEVAQHLLEHVDDLSLVAGISRSQIVRLRDAGIQTVEELASSTATAVPRMTPATFANLRAQASMQVASRRSGAIEWSFRTPDPDRPRRGLALLPTPSPHDVFFDIEGFPFAPGGLEYLLGVVTVDKGTPEFRDWWAHSEEEEKVAFEEFIDWVYARWQADPSLHIYHYAGYERTALGRLMGKYATRELEVDQLFRHHVLVDLYPVVLQGMVIGTPSYSLKDVEHLYMPARTEEVTSAGGSVIEYQRWIDAGESPDPAQSPILNAIRDYNRVDCESTVGLRDWLLARQREAGIAWAVPEGDGKDAVVEWIETPAEILANQLQASAAHQGLSGEELRISNLVAWLLEFHRREEKPYWWKYFERMEASDELLIDDIECLAGLERTDRPPAPVKRSFGFEYRFDPSQETKLRAEDTCAITGTNGEKCTIESLDTEQGIAVLKVGKGRTLPDRVTLIPAKQISTTPLRESILRFAEAWSRNPAWHSALADLLARRAPRITGEPGEFLLDERQDLTSQAIDFTLRLDGSTLCIQGPPGTGKTTTAAEIILALLARGSRVGIVANSHEVVLNLMDRIAGRAEETGVRPALAKVGGERDHPRIVTGSINAIEPADAAAVIAGGPLAIGGTAWLFSRPEIAGTLDFLFIEEAGQFSLANAVAVGAAARNLILLGDQMQLAQPTQGTHPGESGLSVLQYYLKEKATVPPELGIFLGQSYRMHPEVCRVISDAYYEGRLASATVAHANRIIGADRTPVGIESGVRFLPVEHQGNTQDSEEEVEAIAESVAFLLTCQAQVKGAPARQMTLDDILIVAPFNMQVRALKSRLGPAARVGTVDKFQGQEAPVVIVSMCASTLDDAPRGPQFLLSPNRLNVAISRAQALAVVVGSPELGSVRARSLEEMRLVSGWCRIEECV